MLSGESILPFTNSVRGKNSTGRRQSLTRNYENPTLLRSDNRTNQTLSESASPRLNPQMNNSDRSGGTHAGNEQNAYMCRMPDESQGAKLTLLRQSRQTAEETNCPFETQYSMNTVDEPDHGSQMLTNPEYVIGSNCIISHLVDGFLIQESSVPFQMLSGSVLLNEKQQQRRLSLTASSRDELNKDEHSIESTIGGIASKRASNRGRPPSGRTVDRRNKPAKKQNDQDDESSAQTKRTRIGPVGFNMLSPDACGSRIDKDCARSTITTSSPIVGVQSSGKDQESSLSTLLIESINATTKTDHLERDLHNKDPNEWTVDDVHAFVVEHTDNAQLADLFKTQEVDGPALLLLKAESLMRFMNMKIGPALKLSNHISALTISKPSSPAFTATQPFVQPNSQQFGPSHTQP